MALTPASDEAFFESLRGEDELGAVVRAHIHIEARVNQVLLALTRHPKHLPNLRYEQRLRMAVALGLSEDILNPLKILGDIRNAFGHRLDVKLTRDMVDRLFASFTEGDRQIIEAGYAGIRTSLEMELSPMADADVRIKFVVIAVAMDKYLEVAEQEAREMRQNDGD